MVKYDKDVDTHEICELDVQVLHTDKINSKDYKLDKIGTADLEFETKNPKTSVYPASIPEETEDQPPPDLDDDIAPTDSYKLYIEETESGKYQCCSAKRVFGNIGVENQEITSSTKYHSTILRKISYTEWKIKKFQMVHDLGHLANTINFEFLPNWNFDLKEKRLTVAEIEYICRSYFAFCLIPKRDPAVLNDERELIFSYIQSLNLTLYSPWKYAALQIISNPDPKRDDPFFSQLDFILSIIQNIKSKEHELYKKDRKQFLDMFQSLSKDDCGLYKREEVKKLLTDKSNEYHLTEDEFESLLDAIGYSIDDKLIDFGYLITFLHP